MATAKDTDTVFEAKEDLFVGEARAHTAGSRFTSSPGQVDLMGWTDVVKSVGKPDEAPASSGPASN